MKTNEEKIKIMMAFVNGKTIESCRSNCDWHVDKTPSWDWSKEDYRVKDRNSMTPEELEILDKIRAGKEAEVYSEEVNAWLNINYRPQYDDYLKSLILEGSEIRFKPEKKTVAYNNIRQFRDDMMVYGPYIKTSNSDSLYFPVSISDDGILISERVPDALNFISYNHLNDNYTWEDGTKCGQIEK